MAKGDFKKDAAPTEVLKEEVAVAQTVVEESKVAEQELPKAVEQVALEEAKAAVEPVAQTLKAEVPAAPLVDLATHARLNVVGYKEHWWTSIEKYARNHGLKSYKVTAAKASEVLQGWGAKLK